MTANKKIRAYSAMALATAAVLPLACKKEDNTAKDTIDDKTINKTITAGLESANLYVGQDSIDVNSDGIYDFNFILLEDASPGDAYSYFAMYSNSNNEVLSDTTGIVPGYSFLKSPGVGVKIDESQSTWYGYGLGNIVSETYSFDLGNIKSGSGDKYVAFRFKLGANTHYGWAKLNYAANKRSLTIKETAYNKVAGAPINTGAKE